MDVESAGRDSISQGLNLIGLAACAIAVLTSGGLAIVAGAAALGCLFGSIAVSLVDGEAPCDRYWRESAEAPALAAAEPDISPSPEAGPSHHWRQSVEQSRTACRRR